jgi:hypothetical protein
MTFFALDLVSGEQSLTQCRSGGRAVGGRWAGEEKRVGVMWRIVYPVGAGHRVREETGMQRKRINSEKLH